MMSTDFPVARAIAKTVYRLNVPAGLVYHVPRWERVAEIELIVNVYSRDMRSPM